MDQEQMLGGAVRGVLRQHHGGVVVPQPEVRADVVFRAGDGRDIPIVARDFAEALPAKLVQIAIFGNEFYVHLPDSLVEAGWIHCPERIGINCKNSPVFWDPPVNRIMTDRKSTRLNS